MSANQRIEETLKLVAKLQFLDEKEIMFVAGTVAALSAAKKRSDIKTRIGEDDEESKTLSNALS